MCELITISNNLALVLFNVRFPQTNVSNNHASLYFESYKISHMQMTLLFHVTPNQDPVPDLQFCYQQWRVSAPLLRLGGAHWNTAQNLRRLERKGVICGLGKSEDYTWLAADLAQDISVSKMWAKEMWSSIGISVTICLRRYRFFIHVQCPWVPRGFVWFPIQTQSQINGFKK